MAGTSKHPGDIARWIEKVIDSCTSAEHEAAVRKLIWQFHSNLVAQNYKDPMSLIKELFIKVDDKMENRIHGTIG